MARSTGSDTCIWKQLRPISGPKSAPQTPGLSDPTCRKHTVRYCGAAHHTIYKRYGLRPNIAPHQRKLPGHLRRLGHKRWARQLWLVYGVDAISCSRCPGKLEQVFEILDEEVIKRILAHLGTPTEVPIAKPARPPPCPASRSPRSKLTPEDESSQELPLALQEQSLSQEPTHGFLEEDFNQAHGFLEEDFNQAIYADAFPDEDFNQEVLEEEPSL